MGGADRGGSLQRGPADGLNFYSRVPSAAHHQNHVVGRGRLKSSSPSRRLLSFSLSVAVAVAVVSHCIRRGSPFLPDTLQRPTLDLVGAVPVVLKPISTVHSLGHPVYLDLKPPALPVEAFVRRCLLSSRHSINGLQDVVAVFPPLTRRQTRGCSFLQPVP